VVRRFVCSLIYTHAHERGDSWITLERYKYRGTIFTVNKNHVPSAFLFLDDAGDADDLILDEKFSASE
jgi:hypothetical protein